MEFKRSALETIKDPTKINLVCKEYLRGREFIIVAYTTDGEVVELTRPTKESQHYQSYSISIFAGYVGREYMTHFTDYHTSSARSAYCVNKNNFESFSSKYDPKLNKVKVYINFKDGMHTVIDIVTKQEFDTKWSKKYDQLTEHILAMQTKNDDHLV